MSVNLFVRIPIGINAFTGVASSASFGTKCNIYFRPNLKAYARATSQPARFSSCDVVQARHAIVRALILIQARYPVATRMQALHLLLLAHAALKANKQPASARQTPPTKPSVAAPAEKPASSGGASASFRSEKQPGTTRYSTAPPRSRAEAKARPSNSGAKSTNQRQPADEPKRANTEKPKQAKPNARPSNSGATGTKRRQPADEAKRANAEKPKQAAAQESSTASAFEVLGLISTANAAEARKAYYKAAREHHPDKGGDAEKFKVVNNAYEIVKLHFEKTSH